ncbi:MAG TPA: glycosyltransferase, partial [Solirubrobacteraceae bacterium]|nr:glycosyltransferase [Solirubrobacteraceae bacterium]
MSRRFLITLWPFTGHLLPQLSLAIALRERGHEVAFYSGASVRETVNELGFELFEFQRVSEQRAFESMRAVDTGDRRSRPGGGRLLPILRGWLVDTIPEQVADLRGVLARWRPDAIATDLSLWSPIVVLWEAERIPVALSSTFMGPLIPGPDAPAFGFGLRPPRSTLARAGMRALTELTELAGTPMRRRVDALRSQYGLGPIGESVNRYTARLPLYLVGNIPELDYNRHDLPASVHYVGNYIHYPERADSADWLHRISAERPWVHVTESTLAYGDPFLLRTAVQALADEPVELIITTGEHRDARSLGASADRPNVHIAPWISHGRLMPRCAAVVTVGGKATILAAMEAGVPLVVVPTTWDKPDNARRVTEAGAGVRCAARGLEPQRLRDAVREVLQQPSYRAAA